MIKICYNNIVFYAKKQIIKKMLMNLENKSKKSLDNLQFYCYISQDF